MSEIVKSPTYYVMDKAAKLALARKKLKDHQEKNLTHKEENVLEQNQEYIRESLVGSENSKNGNEEEVLKPNIIESSHLKEEFEIENDTKTTDSGVNLAEMLISNKRNLEMQISELHTKLAELDYSQNIAINNNNLSKQRISQLENELKNLSERHFADTQAITSKDRMIKELNDTKTLLTDENNNLQEQLEFTKTILTKKEFENAFLSDKLCVLQNQFDALHLQLQQLTNGSHATLHATTDATKNCDNNQDPEALLQKISSLEHQLKNLQKERDQNNLHYEQYASELNEHIKAVVAKNDELTSEIQNLTNRESSLIEQISNLEIQLQNYHILETVPTAEPEPAQNVQYEMQELQKKLDLVQANFQELSQNYEELKKKYAASEIRVHELSQEKESYNQDNLSISKLNADMTNDKVAAQRATEQNKKLKIDLQELEEAFIKISQDKLELTEKVQAEKYLNRELTIKLAEIEEKEKDMHIKLMAKDVEMIRLQATYREIETKYEKLLNNSAVPEKCTELNVLTNMSNDEQNMESEHVCFEEENSLKIPKEDAMLKLQERFLKIMEEVADLSDEKHRLEHLILQLQNETDTICEYVALYQQQRSLLKKRDEERSAQIKKFQTECELLKKQLEELSVIIIKFTKDTELSEYFDDKSRQNDLSKVMSLLSKLKKSSLIDCNSSELKDFYPCSCCSGKLINV